MLRLYRSTFRIWLIVVFLLFLPGFLRADITGGTVCWPKEWPWERSDLAVDPSLATGVLANGLRYVIKENSEPRGRVAVYLLIGAGSLHEEEEERGLAHYLEHMMFKGSKHYPPGTLINYFQSIGMDFGNDANAFTSFDRTVYNLFLPNGSEEELRRGLTVLTDFAGHALLGESQVEEERGVILAEKRARDSASYRTQVAAMEFAFRGTRLAERMVIGKEEVIAKADSQALRSIYHRWYRPENMTLVLVGDVDKGLAGKIVGEMLSPLTATGDAPQCRPFGGLAGGGTEIFHHYEPELGKTNVSIETFRVRAPEVASLASETWELKRIVGNMILNYRLQRLEEGDEVPFTQIRYSSGDLVERISYGTISAQTGKDKWRDTLAVIEASLRQALMYGFNEDELARAKSEVLAELDARVQTVKSEDSRKLALSIIDHLAGFRVYQSPEQERELFGTMTKALTLAEVTQVFREVWDNDRRLISVTGDAQPENEDGLGILATYQALQQRKIGASAVQDSKVFPYLTPAPATVKAPRPERFQEIAVERLVFDNGLVVNLKHTDFQKNSFQLVAAFGSGEQGEPNPGMAMLGEDAVNLSGTGTLTQAEVEQLIAGSSVSLRFRIGETAFNWVGGALNKDAELLFQLLHAALFDPGLRENRFAMAMQNAELLYRKKERDIEGAMALHISPFLAGGNSHFGLVPWNQVKRATFAGVQQWLHEALAPRELEISVVGEFDRDTIVKLITTYFSGVALAPPRGIAGPAIRFPAGQTLAVEVDTSLEKALLTVAWPTDDAWDIGRTRRLLVLAAIFEDRVRRVVREIMGAAYSPSLVSFSSRTYPGYGYLLAQILAQPGEEKRILEEIKKISSDIHINGISDEELQRGKKPIMTSIKDTIRSNGYWLSSVMTLSSRHPQQLVWPTTIVSDFSAITREEIAELAKRYLDNRQAAVAMALPKKTMSPGEGTDHRKESE